ncbi:hypothetical protein OG2516_15234 [Oceanicola granulosus HTCC2516]|uniref:CENP-V/GFA domain-containing protein n=1 Tax=Oceanicola granulosus (strain ATCC BAA-861 / DSM 15982 / KCTC 12143 / HTCC2516) TaxID=314256 RepID=Q2CFG6_OCEGH|nr:GFA family protein [Oceanicola granulosus]EAR51329.1 hypothetical protein OG2516_15234 [Oceanicola granulosus HTCC2516]
MIERRATCACGQLSATCTGAPLRVSVCHCFACKRRTGSAFSLNARYPEAAVVTAGTSRSFERKGDAGGTATSHFCPTCGTTVWYTNSGAAGLVAIPAGGFASLDVPAPTVSVYHDDSRRFGWAVIDCDPLDRIP